MRRSRGEGGFEAVVMEYAQPRATARAVATPHDLVLVAALPAREAHVTAV